MEVATANSQLYVDTASLGWYFWGGAPAEFHERIAYSAPLVAEKFGLVYVGIHSNEAPIQEGTVRAVDLNSGTLTGFKFNSVGDGSPQIGGGVWNGPATDGSGVYFTTGNTKTWQAPANPTAYTNPPTDNYGLSLVRVDPISGALAWYFQPVPFSLDNDPDWNAGAAIMQTSCGQCIASVMKDGWSYALGADGSCKWQFPFTSPFTSGNLACSFPSTANDGTLHGPVGFHSPGAAWGDVFVVSTGGQALITSELEAEGYGWLHALDVCTLQKDGSPHIRWMFPVPYSTGAANSDFLGAPTVSGGIIYVTTDQGYVVAFVDPSPTYPADTQACSNIDNSDCQTPYYLVPVPHLLAAVALSDGGDAAHLRKEPVLAEGMVYVTTQPCVNLYPAVQCMGRPASAGHVYALAP